MILVFFLCRPFKFIVRFLGGALVPYYKHVCVSGFHCFEIDCWVLLPPITTANTYQFFARYLLPSVPINAFLMISNFTISNFIASLSA